jgi:hypothetical protein
MAISFFLAAAHKERARRQWRTKLKLDQRPLVPTTAAASAAASQQKDLFSF